ncbi:MAG: TonB-dependent receptor plug domain-containing protein [Halioglobus sp.]
MNTKTVSAASAAVMALAVNSAVAESSNPLLEEIIVTSSRIPMPLREVGTSVSVIDLNDIQLRGFSTVANVLRYEPGISVANNGGIGQVTEVAIRGERGYRTKVYIDGIDVTDTSTPQAGPNFANISSTGIERIEILRGPQGMMYGADAGGVINISTHRASEGASGILSAEYGRYGTLQLDGNIAGGNEKADFSLIASTYDTDGFNTLISDPAPQDKDGYENQTVHLRAGVNLTNTLRAEFVGRSVDGDSDFDDCFLAVTFEPSDNCQSDTEQESWRAALVHKGERFNNTLSYNAHSSKSDFLAAGESTFATQGELEKIEYIGSWTPQETLSLVYGIELANEALDDGTDDVDRDQNGVFVEYQGELARDFFVTAGVRYDDNDDFGSETTYRLSGAYLIPTQSGEYKIKGSYGTGFRAPSLSEIAYNNGPFATPPASLVELSAEKSEGFEFGAGYFANAGWFVEANYFYQTTEDEIFFDLLDFSGYLQESGDSESQGIELIGAYQINDMIQINGNYTYNDTEDTSGEQRLRAPENLGNLGLLITPMGEKLTININLRISGDKAAERGADVDDYELLDISASYQVSNALELFGRIENVTDEDYEEIPTFNTSGTAGYAGVRFTF